MSRPVTLIALDGTTVLGNVLLKSDFPADPGILIWNNMVFQSGSIAYGVGSPGQYENYQQTYALDVAAGAVSAPDVAPTVLVSDPTP